MRQPLDVLRSLMIGDCWCDVAINNPMVTRHTDACNDVRELYKRLMSETGRVLVTIEDEVKALDVLVRSLLTNRPGESMMLIKATHQPSGQRIAVVVAIGQGARDIIEAVDAGIPIEFAKIQRPR